MKNIWKPSLAAVTLLLCGTASAVLQWKELPGYAVVISVNGRETTKSAFDGYVKMTEALVRNKKRMMSEDQLRSVRVKIRTTAKKELLGRSLLYANLCTNDIAVSDADREEMKRRYCSSFCRRRQTFDELRDFLRDEEVEDDFMRCFEEDAKIEAALRRAYPDRLAVTADDVSNAVKRVKNYNAVAAATNALICAVATNVLNRIRAGGDFAALADEFSMAVDKNPGGDIGECTINSFAEEGEECMAGAAALKVGEVSGILLGNSGYMILKKTGDSTYSQIFFRKPYEMEELSGDELVEVLKKEYREDLVNELLPKFVKTSKIVFPQGDVFFKLNQSQRGKTKPAKTKTPKKAKNRKGTPK